MKTVDHKNQYLAPAEIANKATEDDANWQLRYDFLLVIHSHLQHYT